jgi:hypothetical protein
VSNPSDMDNLSSYLYKNALVGTLRRLGIWPLIIETYDIYRWIIKDYRG